VRGRAPKLKDCECGRQRQLIPERADIHNAVNRELAQRHTDNDPHGHVTLVYQCTVRCKSPNDNSNDSHENDDNDDDDDDDKYQDLEIAVNRMWKVRTKTVPVQIGALGTIKRGLDPNR